ncbi:MAG: FHA domain-containing protein [Chloroflexota bacterium]
MPKPSPLIDQNIDRYQVLSQLGKDRWGELYKAYDPKFDRGVVLHLLDPQTVPHEQAQQLGRAALHWRHPGIARILDFGQREGWAYLVREFIPGPNLHQTLEAMRQQGVWIGLAEAVQLIQQICHTLSYAHQRGVLHGDLQPENILLQEEAGEELPYQPVLTNLGLINSETPTRASAQAYEAPEQAGGGKINSLGDIYAAGALLYELVAGKAPSRGTAGADNLPESVPFLPASILRPDLPEELEKIILKAVSQQANQRYPDAASMAQALQAVLPQAASITSAPAGLNQAVGLLSVYRSADAVMDSSAKPPAVTPATQQDSAMDISQDKIHILLVDSTVRTLAMKPEGLSFGRSSENDIVLSYPGISRQHARVDFDGNTYQIHDLGSMNGTYLEDKRLPPNTPYPWLPGENVRMGEVWLRLERAGQEKTTVAAPTPAAKPPQTTTPVPANAPPPTQPVTSPPPQTEVAMQRPDGSVVNPSQIKFSSGQGLIGVFIDSPNLSVAPGNSVVASLLLFNRGQSPETLRLNFEGVPLEWIPNRPQSVSLPANGQREVQIHFRPPRAAESRAGRHMVTLRAISQNKPAEGVEVRLALTLAAFSQFSSELRPKQLLAGKTAQVVVQNQGNLPETFTIGWDDPQRELAFDPPQARVTVPPGHSAVVEFRPSLAQPRLLGGEMRHTFNALVSSQAGPYQTHPGEVTSRGLVPAWTPIALASLCIILACITLIFINQVTSPSRAARQTDTANQTALAQVTQGTAQALTLTADALSNANQATLAAVTSTATWSEADDDQDGLPNGQELLYLTRPDVADTDEDGLSDGDEVNKYKTFPLIADSDVDGLKDGVEVQRGLDPLKRDTDGDGLDDAIDPDPLHPATATPGFKTPTPTVTGTPTLVPTTAIPSTDLMIAMNNGVNSSIPGTSVAYTILVTNKGPGAVTNAQVINSLPSVLVSPSWTCSATGGSRCVNANGNGNIDARVDLAVNGTATFIVSATVSPNATGLLINTASVTAPSGVTESNTVDNLAVDTDTLTPKVSYALTVTDNRTTIAPGEPTSYSIVATNGGPSAATGVSIQDFFPDALTGMTWTCNPSPGSSCSVTGAQSGNINVNVNLNPGSSITINANGTVKPSATGTIENTVTLSSPIDPGTNNKSVIDVTTIVPKTDLSISVIAPITMTVNTPLTYTINITNTGPVNASGVVVTDQLPVGVTFLSSNPGAPICTVNVNQVTCNIGSLAVGTTIQIEIVIITPVTPGSIVSQFEVKANEVDPVPANNTKTVEVLIE